MYCISFYLCILTFTYPQKLLLNAERRKSSRARAQTTFHSSAMYQDSFEKARAIAAKSKSRKRTSSNGNVTNSANNYLLKKSKTENLPSANDLRRSKRKRQDSSHDLEIALKNSLLDFGGDNALKSEFKSQSNKSIELNSSKKRKRSLSLTLESSESSSSNNDAPNSPSSSSSSSSSDQSCEDYPEFNEKLSEFNESNEESFIKFLNEFMTLRGTPILKIPVLGFKKSESYVVDLKLYFLSL